MCGRAVNLDVDEKMCNSMGMTFFIGVISFLLLYRVSFFVTWDLSEYLTVAINLAKEKGAIDIEWDSHTIRIGFTWLLACVLKAASYNLVSIAATIALGSTLFLLFVYRLGCVVGGWFTGIVTVVMILSSPDIIYAIPRLLDAFWPACLLASLLCLLSKKHENALWSKAVAGVLTGVAILIKPVALLFLLFPFVIFLARLPIDKKSAVSFYAGVAIVLLPFASFWGKEVASIQQKVFLYPGNELAGAGFFESIAILSDFVITGMRGYVFSTEFSRGLWGSLAGTPVLLVGVLVGTIMGLKKNKKVLCLVCAILLFSPMNIIIGFYNLRLGQNLFGIALMYLVTAYVFVMLMQYVTNAYSARRVVPLLAIVLLVSFGSYQWLHAARSPRISWGNSMAKQLLSGNWHSDVVLRGAALGDWVADNVPEDVGIMVDSIPIANGAYFRLNTDRKVFRVPFTVLGDYVNFPPYMPEDGKSSKPLYLFSSGAGSNKQVFMILDAHRLAAEMHENNIGYIALHKRRSKELIDLLHAQNGVSVAAEVKDASGIILVFAVDTSVFMPSGAVAVSGGSFRFLEWLQSTNQERYKWYMEKLERAGVPHSKLVLLQQ